MKRAAGLRPADCLQFSALDCPGLQHLFTLRSSTWKSPESAVSLLDSAPPPFVQAAQIHGNGVARVGPTHAGQSIPSVDALVTDSTGLALLVRVADCGPLYFYDPVRRVIALAHSGRKGTEQNIAGATLQNLKRHYGSRPEDVITVLGPCIRPPHYEVDFAREICRQVRAEGVVQVHDCGLNTASDRERFYSYRMEKGETGRHHAVLRMI
ncbi:MAG: polyphenol oxidase family protein [Methylacidiphilales bacterium]|nr:polyphenol oxidase family protein [Candidatus Methylacidiphilales bacterium]